MGRFWEKACQTTGISRPKRLFFWKWGSKKVVKRCYFFAVKWEFDKMGIWTKMLAVWVKMGSHFIENVLYSCSRPPDLKSAKAGPAARIWYCTDPTTTLFCVPEMVEADTSCSVLRNFWKWVETLSKKYLESHCLLEPPLLLPRLRL